MGLRWARFLLVCALMAVTPVAASCGTDEEDRHVEEGEPVELGSLRYNVQLTRFLSPSDPGDRAVLAGQDAAAPRGKAYLAVFMRIDNEGDETATIPTGFEVVDTRDNRYEPLPIDGPFTLDLGGTVAGHSEAPAPGTPAASGPAKGAALIFLVDEQASENRPLELEIAPPEGEPGTVELDI